jgi:hypothetical protein
MRELAEQAKAAAAEVESPPAGQTREKEAKAEAKREKARLKELKAEAKRERLEKLKEAVGDGGAHHFDS